MSVSKMALNTLPGADDITRVVLPNGITVLARENPNSPSMVISGYLGCGSQFDPDDKLGLAYFTSLALMRGTEQRDFQTIYHQLESMGASLGFGVSVHNASFAGRSLVEDISLLLEILADCIRHPVFPAEQVERLRAQMLTALAIRAQDTADMASLTFDRILFSKHPYGKPEDGYVETIQNICLEDIAAFHRACYGPSGMVIAGVGALAPARLIQEVERALGDWQNPNQSPIPELPRISPPQDAVRQHVEIPGKFQTDLVLGTLGPKRSSPDYMAAMLGNNILGQFGMMGRIGDVVREKEGLAYYASTSLNCWIEAGSWEVSAGVNPSNVDRALELILAEIRRFVKEPVTREELEDSQANFVGRLPLSMESNAGVANALLNLERFQLGLDYYRRYPEMVAEVTPEMILETARTYLDPERLIVVSAGTSKE
ncbi:MAG: insulinase family protein [Anaerolineae bacterium]|nr:insulinase family protein [Anaerolineae bacterium]